MGAEATADEGVVEETEAEEIAAEGGAGLQGPSIPLQAR
jgi:hypothetical protein|eukprot:COSAG02_NODE_615_length_19511_cov_64.132701_21_plen_39_part_00